MDQPAGESSSEMDGATTNGEANEVPSIEQLVSEYLPAVYRYAFRLAGSAADADDLVQQAFLIAQQRLDQLREASKARAWLFSILRSCFLKRLRKSKPTAAADLDMDLGQVSAPWDTDIEIDAEALHLALADLSDQDRAILLMFYFEEASYKQIAEAFELKMGTVMSRLSRAKDRLRTRLMQRPEFQQ